MLKTLAIATLCLVVGATRAAETYPLDHQGAVRDWLLGGPYPSYWVNNAPAGYATDFLAELGGEPKAAPYPGLTGEAEFRADVAKLIAGIGSTNEWGYKKTRTFPVRWRELHWDKTEAVSLDGLFAPLEDHIVAYAFCYVEAQEEQTVKLLVNSDDDHKVWLNGKLLGGVNKSQPVTADSAVYPAKLERGLNRLLLKVVDRTHGHAFRLAIRNEADKPLAGVRVRLDHPRRKLLARVPGLKRVDAWDRGFYAGISLAEGEWYAGPNTLWAQVGVPSPGSYTFTFLLHSSGKEILAEKRTADVATLTDLVEWHPTAELPAGPLEFRVLVHAAGHEAPVAELRRTAPIIDLKAIAAENAAMEKTLAEADSKLAEVTSRQRGLEQSTETLQNRRKTLYAEIERAYAAKRRGLRSNPPAIDEPATSAEVLRRRICLNGDQWLAAEAAKPKEGQTSAPPAAADAWHGICLPTQMFSTYFRSWHYPVRNLDAKNPYGKIESLPGWSEFAFSPLLCKDRVWFRKEVQLSRTEAAGACTFVCENVAGKLRVYLNGTLCGEYFGNIGTVSIPLVGAEEGTNVLDLHLEAPLTVGIPQGKFTTHWGLRGDIFLDIATPVAVTSATVKTTWRDARIAVATELENRGTAPVLVRVDQYCVLGNRVKYRFQSQTASVPAGSTLPIRNDGVWTEAKPWGIGGSYGEPVLYDLVTDTYVDGRLQDRHVVPFGFREFWIAGTDFYLNGKRIILQGDVGLGELTGKRLEVVLPLLRADGINTIRIHDSDYWSVEFLRTCDRLGMLVYAQMYPILHDKKPRKNREPGEREYIPYDDWLMHPLHAYNLGNYERWVEMLQNHPSVVIASTDNEIFTQSWDHPEAEAFNIRNDRLGAFYGQYVKSLDPSLIITRDGDEGTWGHKGKWHEDPPCDTANYHYPDFHIDQFVTNWQTVYDFRPAVFGETLYCSYGAWNDWIGAIPSQVQKKADTVRRVATLYRELGIPAQIYMGLSSDGFIQIDDTGQHNPWGVTASIHRECKEKGASAEKPGYPWTPIPWPSQSGLGHKPPAAKIDIGSYGHRTINWFDGKLPSHVRNAVNDAYRDSLLPMPPLALPSDAECILELGPAGAGRTVIARNPSGHATAYGVVADSNGRAWFRLPEPGAYVFECGGESMQQDIPARADYAAKPGFSQILRIDWETAR